VQVWLDVVCISSSLLLGCGSGLDVSNLAFSSYLHHQFFNQLLFRAGRSMNATPAQSPVRKAHAGWKNYFGFALFFFTQLF
jgi:hypothetical protein